MLGIFLRKTLRSEGALCINVWHNWVYKFVSDVESVTDMINLEDKETIFTGDLNINLP